MADASSTGAGADGAGVGGAGSRNRRIVNARLEGGWRSYRLRGHTRVGDRWLGHNRLGTNRRCGGGPLKRNGRCRRALVHGRRPGLCGHPDRRWTRRCVRALGRTARTPERVPSFQEPLGGQRELLLLELRLRLSGQLLSFGKLVLAVSGVSPGGLGRRS